ncbi:S-layer homology domain-containing protein [Sporosarcina psychrophila]|uniref:S-layer homology domain-containing protein n=1 Tax=Sporosarcina psychrophila TaxID=1476 RepID=UPI00078D1AFA|nr:S-layer homology domain-containing protein [Sporosarcina psychrophila]AMQ06711.1 hypothetical protein AZE41_12645 [Sporosarcina psychrophila]
MSRKLFVASLAAAFTLPAVIVPIHTEAAVKDFRDVLKNSPYYNEITAMADQGIIFGYTDGTFKPNDVILRRHAAALVNRAKGKILSKTTAYVKFKDVPESHPNYADIRALQQAGIFTPDSKGNFSPNKPLTRVEMAKVLVMAFDLEIKSVHNFPDVPTSSENSEYVQAIYSNGITVGSNGKFLPNESLSRAHYAVFMHRAMNMDVNFVAPPITKPTPTPQPGGGKVYPDGWVAPVLKSAWSSKDGVNSLTLQNELGFKEDGSIFGIKGKSKVITVVGQSSSSPIEVELVFYGWTDKALPESYRVPVVAKELFKLYFGNDAIRVWNYANNNDIPEQFKANGRNVKVIYSEAVGAIVFQVGRK